MNVEDFEFPDSQEKEDADIPEEELNPQPSIIEHDKVPDALQTLGYGDGASSPKVVAV
jgi:hypothetical protein